MARMRKRTEDEAKNSVEAELERVCKDTIGSLLPGWQDFPEVQDEMKEMALLVMEEYPDENDIIDFDDNYVLSEGIRDLSITLKNALIRELNAAQPPPDDANRQPPDAANPAAHKQANRDRQKEPKPGAGRREAAAAKTASEYLAWHMNHDDQIKEFRRRVLGDEEGTDYDQGIRFITSPLAKVLSVEDFSSLRLIPVTCTGKVLLWAEQWDESIKQPVTSLVEMLFPTGRPYHAVRRDELPEKMDFIVAINVPFPKIDGEMAIKVKSLATASYACISYPRPTSFFGFPEDDGIFHLAPPYLSPAVGLPFDPDKGYMEGLEGSVALEALGLCQHIMEACPVAAWDALIFLMTGKFSIPSLDGHFFDYRSPAQANGSQPSSASFTAMGPHKLYVQPWISPQDLSDFWRHIRPKEAARPLPSEENMAVFRFVLEQTKPGDQFRWEAMTTKWNKEKEGKLFDRSEMKQTYLRVLKALFPYHGQE